VVLWINGPFGVGKTSVARALVQSRTDMRLFDPEWVGYMLQANLPDVPHDDFQDLAPWRALVPRVVAEVSRLTGQTLVVVQTVVVESYWRELSDGLETEGLTATMVLLHCETDELVRRIGRDENEPNAQRWRLSHISAYEEAHSWLIGEAAEVIDTTKRQITETAEIVANSYGQDDGLED
jgi:shikimate kinase